jgi:hypothetical protein
VSDYRPIADVWMLARPKVPYYGAYPNGFLELARVFFGSRYAPILHVCGGHAKQYPTWRTVCPVDRTLDLDPLTQPDYVQDARQPLPRNPADRLWLGILCDPPYTMADAEHYRVGQTVLPSAGALLKNALAAVRVGGRVGMLHYELPRPPATSVKFIAAIAVVAGFGNTMRCFSVFERTA